MAQAEGSSRMSSSSSVCNLTVEEFAEEVAKRLKTDRYTRFIIEEEVSGESFLSGGDALLQTFEDMDNERPIKKGHLATLQGFRKSCSPAIQGSTSIERCSGNQEPAGSAERDGEGRELAGVQEGEAPGKGEAENGGKKIKIAPATNGTVRYTAEEIFQTLWHSKKWMLVVGKHGVRRLQGLFANLSGRVYVDLGLDEYAPAGTKEKERPPEELLERLKAVNLQKNQADKAWRDGVYRSIVEEVEHGGEVTALDGTVFKWPKKSFNASFTSVVDNMRRRFLQPEKYKSGQAKKLQKYHARKPVKKRANAGTGASSGDSAAHVEEIGDGSQGASTAEAQQPKPDAAAATADADVDPSQEHQLKDQETGTGAETPATVPPGSTDQPEKTHKVDAENETVPSDPPAPSTVVTDKAAPAPVHNAFTTLKSTSGCAIEGCTSSSKVPKEEICAACLEPLHKDCLRAQLKKLYGVEQYSGDQLYCSAHIAKYNFREGLGGKCVLPGCFLAGKVTQHACGSCKAPVHNLCFQRFLSQEYGKKDFDGDGFACKEHAEALGLKKVPAAQTSSSVDCAKAMLDLAETQVDSPMKGSRKEAGGLDMVGDRGEKQASKRKGGEDVGEKQTKKQRTAGLGTGEKHKPEQEETNGNTEKGGKAGKTRKGEKGEKSGKAEKGDKSGKVGSTQKPDTPAPKSTEPDEDATALRQSKRKVEKNKLIFNASHVVPSQPAGVGAEKRVKGNEKAGQSKKKRKRAPTEDDEDSLSLSGSVVESSDEESDAEAQTDLPESTEFEDKNEPLTPSMKTNYELIAMKALDVDTTFKLTQKVIVEKVKKLKLPRISSSPELPNLPFNYLLKLLAEGLLKKKKIVIKGNKWRDDGALLRKTEIVAPLI